VVQGELFTRTLLMRVKKGLSATFPQRKDKRVAKIFGEKRIYARDLTIGRQKGFGRRIVLGESTREGMRRRDAANTIGNRGSSIDVGGTYVGTKSQKREGKNGPKIAEAENCFAER